MEDQLRYLPILRKLLGDDPARRVMLVTTKGNMLPEGRAMAVENELLAKDRYWGRMKERGSRLIRHTGDKETAMRILDSVLQAPTSVILDIQQEMVNQRLNLGETTAGKEVDSKEVDNNLEEDMLQHHRRLGQLKDEYHEALAIQDLEFQQELKFQELKIQELQFALKEEKVDASYDTQISTSSRILEDKMIEVQRLQEQQTQSRKEMIEKFEGQLREEYENFQNREKKVTAIDSVDHTLNQLVQEYTTVSDDCRSKKW